MEVRCATLDRNVARLHRRLDHARRDVQETKQRALVHNISRDIRDIMLYVQSYSAH